MVLRLWALHNFRLDESPIFAAFNNGICSFEVDPGDLFYFRAPCSITEIPTKEHLDGSSGSPARTLLALDAQAHALRNPSRSAVIDYIFLDGN